MAVDQKNLSELEQMWGKVSDFSNADIQALNSKNWLGVLTGGNAFNLGAQNQDYANSKIQAMLASVTDTYKQAQQQLSQFGDYFNPDNYKIDASGVVNIAYANGGEYANRIAPLAKARQQIMDMQSAIDAAKKAAEAYTKTGQVTPPPDRKQYLNTQLQVYGEDRGIDGIIASAAAHPYDTQDQNYANAVKAVVAGEPMPDSVKQAANAAAAYVGAPLPYSDSAVGKIREGGVLSNEQLKNAQDRGLNYEQARGAATSSNYANLDTPPITPANGQTNGTTTGATGSTTSGTGGTSSTTGATGSTTGTGSASGTTIDPQAQANAMAVLNKYLNDGTIDSGTYQFFKKAVETWDPSQQIDYANILNTFETIKQNDINPYFQEQANLFINDLQTNRQYLQDTRALEVTQQNENAQKLKENMQNDLASRGMLFTGEAVKQLGDQSAFAVEGTPQAAQSAIPTIQPFAGTGELQKQTQAAASSSALRYQKSLQDLQQQAESTLGTTGSAGLVPGATQIGGITGSLANQKKQAQASALVGLYNQSTVNTEARKPQEVFNQ